MVLKRQQASESWEGLVQRPFAATPPPLQSSEFQFGGRSGVEAQEFTFPTASQATEILMLPLKPCGPPDPELRLRNQLLDYRLHPSSLSIKLYKQITHGSSLCYSQFA